MKLVVSGKNFDVTEALKDRVVSKIGKLDKFIQKDVESHVTMSVEKNRQIVEVTIPLKGNVFRATEETDDMYASIDKIVDILERQIRKNKTKSGRKIKDGATIKNVSLKDSLFSDDDNYPLVRYKTYDVKPMTVEDTILQMDESEYGFYIFTNADTKKVSVVYKRKHEGYGIIEPEE